jgi:isochorismate hydrolase
MPSRHPNILTADSAILVLIDLQEPILRVVQDRDRVASRCALLAQSAGILSVPVIATVQYAQRMGGVVDDIARHCPACASPIDKMCFSCAGSSEFVDAVRASGRTQILIGGIETHVCVAQTALDLLLHGYQVHVAADAVSSRALDQHKLGMEKMRDSGVIACSSDQAVFEMLRIAGTTEFKKILPLLKN